MSLHILAKPELFAQCKNLLSTDDALLLIEDGVYLAAQVDLALPCPAFALESDFLARGMADCKTVLLTTDDGFVNLCCEHSNSVSWF